MLKLKELQLKLDIKSKNKTLTVGEVVKFDGFLKVYNTSTLDSKNEQLPDVSEDEILVCNEISATQKFSRPSDIPKLL